MEKHTFKLKDEDGGTHTYVVTRHGARKGSLLRARIAALVAEPIAALIYEAAKLGDIRKAVAVVVASLAPDSDLTDPSARAELDRQRAEVLAIVNPSALATAARNALISLPEDLIFALFEHVTRDGIPIGADGYEDTFDLVYAGNYVELESALWEVVTYNRFLSLPAIFSAAKAG
jgi:hypothetical protein